LQPDLINLPNLMFLGVARRLKQTLKVPIVCALAGEDIFLDVIPQPHRTEAFQLIEQHAKYIDAFTAPTRYYAAHCTDHFHLPAEKIHYIPMGIAVDDFERLESRNNGPMSVGYLARICPEKGLHLLADAFHQLRRRGHEMRLHIAGYLGRSDRAYWNRIRKQLATQGHWPRVTFQPDIDRDAKIRFLQSVNLFSVPTTYPESKGLSLLEAKAAGLPIVQPRHGVFPELIEASNGGVLCEPNNAGALADAIESLIRDPEQWRLLGQNARAYVQEHHTDEIMARETWKLFEKVAEAFRHKKSDPSEASAAADNA
jgi:glycosyltransferase involved in cell wall biosynthesis